jgi:SAM-dependent methyltransferase
VCDLVFLNPQPWARVLRKYLDEYDLAAHFATQEARKEVLFKQRLDLIGGAESRDKLWDVACGDGQFLQLARARGWDGTGVELNPAAARRARERGYQVVEGLFEELDQLPWGECAVATSWDTLEHSPRPRLFLEQLARLLRPGGRLYLTTLNNDAIVARVFRTRWSMLVEDHFTYWNLRSLTRVLSVTGFEIRSVWHFGLGRDFAPWSRRRHAEQSHRSGGGGDLMASASLVAVEQLVNRLLNSTHLGVGIGVEARRLPRP